MHLKKKKQQKIQNQVLELYNDEFACFSLGDNKHLKIYTHTHTRGSRTSGVLELYLNTAGLNQWRFQSPWRKAH